MSKRLTQQECLKRFKEIHGDKYDYSKVVFKNVDEKVCIICKEHGEFWQTPYKHINRKQGCPHCGHIKTSKSKVLSNEKILNNLKARGGYEILKIFRKSGKIFLDLKCKKCKRIFSMSYSHFLHCENCVCYRKKTEKIFLKEAEKKFPNLFIYSDFKYNGSEIKSKFICKKCKKMFERTPHEFLRSGNCPYCRPHKTENRIATWLEKEGLEQNKDFFRKWTFEDLKDKSYLRFDYYIPYKKLFIEFNGDQHYKFPNGFHKTYRDFLVQKHHDWLKRKYAKDNGYKLLTISYKNKYNLEQVLEENFNE